MEAWYVAKTKATKERWVQTYLTQRIGLNVFLPLLRRRTGGRTTCEPLFPTYLFCCVDPESADWATIRWAPGLSYFLGNGQENIPVSDELVDYIKRRVSWWNDGGYVPRFAPGEQVIVTSGAFSGLEGVFQRHLPGRQRCQVLLDVLGQVTKVEIPAEALGSPSPYKGLALGPAL